ncbi:GNAT family N-acetyltransferase [[Phormidium ambiguum] IAM M-71]|uniref:GNAT family N-acetyltransferase n=1 Tax=[Phormidium ambiguum] IAM M-71 TaxID=454136 RepID=A0A1U7IRS7_9CYAN|nr:GNAT family N-acetyltransferase [Phormidium ambiguum]OKH40151.1 GNAT family N-acetyltransferase [Phormidium ambiguum IAM M-71]
MEWIFCSIDDDTVNRDNFDCGVPELNEYLKKYARQNDRRGIAKTFVAISEGENKDVAGYYSVGMAEIKRESLPANYQRGIPRYPVPSMRLTRLAVAVTMQGKGLGGELLIECFRKAVRLSSEVGIFAVIVDAKNQPAKEFYLKYGFIPLEDNELSLFIPIATITKVLKIAP